LIVLHFPLRRQHFFVYFLKKYHFQNIAEQTEWPSPAGLFENKPSFYKPPCIGLHSVTGVLFEHEETEGTEEKQILSSKLQGRSSHQTTEFEVSLVIGVWALEL
jgi:hypothetical protein